MARTADRALALSRQKSARAPRDEVAELPHARAWAAHLLDALDVREFSSPSFPRRRESSFHSERGPYLGSDGLDSRLRGNDGRHWTGPENNFLSEHAVLSWASSGLMALTGEAQGKPQICPLPLAACADGALAALAAIAPPGALKELRGSQLLAERAALSGHARRGHISPGGSCRLLCTTDGEIALNLARDADWDLLPALLEQDCDRSWEAVAAQVATRATDSLLERGRLLGLALASSLQDFRNAALPTSECEITAALRSLPCVANEPDRPPLVVDLSSLWAGPLCSHLLQLCGAEVIKIESLHRPDGARAGSPAFFDLLNSGKRSVVLDFQTAQGRGQLRELLQRADIVIEASRPRALRQLDIDAESIVREYGSTWISLSGYGRGEPQEQWIAYGDDAGVAAGLSAVMREVTGRSLFVGDAIADPLTGIHAALLAWASWCGGGTRLIPLSLTGVTRECMQFDLPQTAAELRARHQAWTSTWRDHGAVVAAPSARAPQGRAASLGEHTDAVLKAPIKINCHSERSEESSPRSRVVPQEDPSLRSG